jgi:uncharacterized OB-fold protein
MTSAETERSFPDVPFVVEPGVEPYWEAASEGRLVLPRCAEDGAFLWPPRRFCPRHITSELDWQEVTGRGVVHTYSVVHRGEGAFAATSPYVLAYIELEEGPRILTNLMSSEGHPVTEVEVGTRVVARFAANGEEFASVLRFVPVG